MTVTPSLTLLKGPQPVFLLRFLAATAAVLTFTVLAVLHFTDGLLP